MILFQQARKLLLTISLVLLVSTSIGLGLAPGDSWAATSLTDISGQPHIQIAMMDRGKAVSKNIEGKAQEAFGNVTGDPKDQAVGKAKQAESQVRNTMEDVKSTVSFSGRAKAVSKNLDGKTQEAAGNITGDVKNQAAGKAKQAESQVRNTIEDVKAKVQDIFN
jgi:uncharacterized protein YjbJ (UPF0337 family)